MSHHVLWAAGVTWSRVPYRAGGIFHVRGREEGEGEGAGDVQRGETALQGSDASGTFGNIDQLSLPDTRRRTR